MASLIHNPDGTRMVQVICPDKKRRTIRLGKVSKRQGEVVLFHIEDLVAAGVTGHSPSDKTARWLRGLGDTLHERGRPRRPEPGDPALSQVVQVGIHGRARKVVRGTRRNDEHARRVCST